MVAAGNAAVCMEGLTTANNIIAVDSSSVSFTINCYNKNYKQEYFTIVSLADNNTISWKCSNSSYVKQISYSKNKTSWSSTNSTTYGYQLATLSYGEKLYIKGTNEAYGNLTYTNVFTSTRPFYVEGNIMSLLSGDNFAGWYSSFSAQCAFKSMLSNT